MTANGRGRISTRTRGIRSGRCVIDADPEARKGQNEVTVKIASITEPTAPPEAHQAALPSVVFDGLSVTPYVRENGGGRPRVAFSLRALDIEPAAKPRGSE